MSAMNGSHAREAVHKGTLVGSDLRMVMAFDRIGIYYVSTIEFPKISGFSSRDLYETTVFHREDRTPIFLKNEMNDSWEVQTFSRRKAMKNHARFCERVRWMFEPDEERIRNCNSATIVWT